MASPTMKKTLVNVIVDRGIKDIAEDSHRSIRKMTDLGKYFSNSPFQNYIFSLFQQLILNDDSPYYTAIENLIHQTDNGHLKTMAVNLGYNSWISGADIIRRQIERLGCAIPWTIFFHMSDTESDLNLIKKYVQEGQDLGLYNFVIFFDTSCKKAMFDCISALNEFPDCSFFIIFPELSWNEHWINLCANAKNMMPLLPLSSLDIHSTAVQFNRKKLLFSIYIKTDVTDAAVLEPLIRLAQAIRCPFFFRLPENPVYDMLPETSPFIVSARLEQKYPLFLCDAYSDTVHIGKVISKHSGVIEIQNKYARWIDSPFPQVSMADGSNLDSLQGLLKRLNNVK